MKPRRPEEVLQDLVRDQCPDNWGDDLDDARLWLEAEAATGIALPDPDYFKNQTARQRLAEQGPRR